MELSFEINSADLAEQIGDWRVSHDDLIELITLIDANVADWDFTIRLRDTLTKDIPQDVQDDYDKAKLLEATGGRVFAFYDFIIQSDDTNQNQ